MYTGVSLIYVYSIYVHVFVYTPLSIYLGIISEEEEKRRKELLHKYLDYQHASEHLTKDSTIRLKWQNGLSYAHKVFEHCMGWVYYTETD